MNVLMFVNESMIDPNKSYVTKWNTELAKGFEELGHNVLWINFSEDEILKKINEIFNQKIDFAFGFNVTYVNALQLQVTNGNERKNILNMLDIPFVSWFWDGICVPMNPAARFPGIKHLLVACINEDEVEELRIVSPHVKQAFFLPLSGCLASSNVEGTGNSKGGGINLLKIDVIKFLLLELIIKIFLYEIGQDFQKLFQIY